MQNIFTVYNYMRLFSTTYFWYNVILKHQRFYKLTYEFEVNNFLT